MDKTKQEFIWKRGVLGVGFPVAILMALTLSFQVPGYLFHLEGFNFKRFMIGLVVFVPVFSVAGYFWGVIVYRLKQRR